MSEIKRVGIIDVGSMKTKVVAAEFSPDLKRTILLKERALTQLSNGLSEVNNLISSQAIEVQIEVLIQYMKMLSELNVEDILLIGTEALRRADNSEDVVQRIHNVTGNTLEVLSHEDEARAFFDIVSSSIPGKLVIADVGGGSVQIIVGEDGVLEDMHLIKTGTMTLRGGKFDSHFPDEEELNKARERVKTEVYQLQLNSDPDAKLVYGSTNIEDFFREAGVGTDTVGADGETVFSATIEEVTQLYNEIIQFTFEDRAKFFPSDPFFMWGADMSLINIMVLCQNTGIKTVIPTNLNISDGLLLGLVKKSK